jgi:hypothetical protein
MNELQKLKKANEILIEDVDWANVRIEGQEEYIKKLKKQNKELLEIALYLYDISMGMIKQVTKNKIESITGKSIKEVLKDEHKK